METSRFLMPEEVELLLNLSLSSDTRWRVLIATRDDGFCAAVADLFADDEQVWIERVATGCEALASCVRHTPDLFVLDADLPDLQSRFLLEFLHRDKELLSLKVLCRLNRQAPPDIAGWMANDFILGDNDLEKVYLSRKLHTLLYASDSQPETDFRAPDERRWPRTSLQISARVGICDSDGSAFRAQGEAMVENISFGGACLSGIPFETASVIPGVSRLTLSIDQPHLPGFTTDSILLRYHPGGSAGVRFLDMSKNDRLKLLELFEA